MGILDGVLGPLMSGMLGGRAQQQSPLRLGMSHGDVAGGLAQTLPQWIA
jgi:hypothetical protein